MKPRSWWWNPHRAGVPHDLVVRRSTGISKRTISIRTVSLIVIGVGPRVANIEVTSSVESAGAQPAVLAHAGVAVDARWNPSSPRRSAASLVVSERAPVRVARAQVDRWVRDHPAQAWAHRAPVGQRRDRAGCRAVRQCCSSVPSSGGVTKKTLLRCGVCSPNSAVRKWMTTSWKPSAVGSRKRRARCPRRTSS